MRGNDNVVFEIYKNEAEIIKAKIQKETYTGDDKSLVRKKLTELIKELEIVNVRMKRLL